MKILFDLSGSCLHERNVNFVPEIGSKIRIKTESYKKGLPADSIIEIIVGKYYPMLIDMEGEEIKIIIDLSGYELIEEGPPPEI